MLVQIDEIAHLLRSPIDGGPLQRSDRGFVSAGDPAQTFFNVGSAPVLIDFEKSVFLKSQMIDQGAQSQVERPRDLRVRRVLRRMVSPPKACTETNITEFIRQLLERRPNPLVLVIGGGTVGQGLRALYDHVAVRVLALDVYASPMVPVIADAHQLPLASRSVDGVVVQAVLEHVLEPAKVVEEIWRVLSDDGLIYAETPFLQHVHEGAYDFTRFTGSGHRWLFRRFSALGAGVCGGPGTQLLWSIDYFTRSLFRSPTTGKAFKLAFFWLPMFDRLIPADYASDAASGHYFLGAKTLTPLGPSDIIAQYDGAQRARATAL